jgi:hypothetical protein
MLSSEVWYSLRRWKMDFDRIIGMIRAERRNVTNPPELSAARSQQISSAPGSAKGGDVGEALERSEPLAEDG